jgi:hypothetical protein
MREAGEGKFVRAAGHRRVKTPPLRASSEHEGGETVGGRHRGTGREVREKGGRRGVSR